MHDFIGGVLGGFAAYVVTATVQRYLIWRRSRRFVPSRPLRFQ